MQQSDIHAIHFHTRYLICKHLFGWQNTDIPNFMYICRSPGNTTRIYWNFRHINGINNQW